MKKLLVIVDPQNSFINGRLGSFEAASAIPNIARKAISWDGDIIITQDTHDKNYLKTNEGRHLPIEHCIKGTYEWELNPYLVEQLHTHNVEYAVIEKDRFGSFYLATICEYEGYDYVEIVGLCTDICVISNAILIKNSLPESYVVVDAKCCAGSSAELHKKALDVMESCHIDVINKVS